MKVLLEHLGEFYRQHVLNGRPPVMAAHKLRHAIRGDSNLRETARQRLIELDQLDASSGGNLAKRCFVSHVQRTALKEAFDG